jgi:adenosylcobinamide-phosphate synthase
MHELFYVLALAVLIDRIFGEPPGRFHSTVWIGKLCELMQKRFSNSIIHGIFLFLSVTLISSLTALSLLLLFGEHFLAIVVGALILKMQFSWKGLSDYALPVLDALEQDIARARERLFYIVGRDTRGLDEEGILSATVESVGEGTNDGITAPLFYYVLFGALFSFQAGVFAAVFFRAVNTLDSMVGYNKEGYDRIGLTSARADDTLNFFPARITALLMILSSFILRENFKNAVWIFRRDRNNTKSPNAGQAMAVMAGALGVRLEKPGHHTLGEPLKELQNRDVRRAIGISNLTTVLFLFVSAVIILQ